MKNFKLKENLKELYGEHIYLPIRCEILNILLDLLYQPSLFICPSPYPSIKTAYFFKAFQRKLQTSVHFFLKEL